MFPASNLGPRANCSIGLLAVQTKLHVALNLTQYWLQGFDDNSYNRLYNFCCKIILVVARSFIFNPRVSTLHS